jgi:hypothetical protein
MTRIRDTKHWPDSARIAHNEAFDPNHFAPTEE